VSQLKYFGTIVGPPELTRLQIAPVEGIYGMTVFVRRFLTNLLLHGDFDELHFFYVGLESASSHSHIAWVQDPRIRFIPLDRFAAEIARTAYHVFHNPWSPDIGPWTDLRNRLSEKNIPVTGLTHTISYQSFLPRVLGTMLLGPQPWDCVVCTTESARKAMRAWIEYLSEKFRGQHGVAVRFDARLEKIPLGVDTTLFRPGPRQDLRQRLGLNRDDVIALYLGRFSHYDKMDLFPLLLAFRSAIESPTPPAVLVLAGSESFHKYSQRVREFASRLGIADRVIIRTDIPDADVPDLYAAADFFVSPSDNLQETFGQTIIEAMASGLPVVCSNWDGYKELVTHEKTDLLVPTYWMDCNGPVCDYAGVSDWLTDHFRISQSVAVDVPALASAIRRLIADSGLREKWGQQARLDACRHYNWAEVIRQYLELWRALRDQADAAPSHPQVKDTWFRPDFFATFRDYPSNIVGPETIVTSGIRREIEIYPELSDQYFPEVFDSILNNVSDTVREADLEHRVTSALAIPIDLFQRHLLWLVKYGHLRLD
jgi:D-inositol-3-phosphate glycosyltransferase